MRLPYRRPLSISNHIKCCFKELFSCVWGELGQGRWEGDRTRHGCGQTTTDTSINFDIQSQQDKMIFSSV